MKMRCFWLVDPLLFLKKKQNTTTNQQQCVESRSPERLIRPRLVWTVKEEEAAACGGGGGGGGGGVR